MSAIAGIFKAPMDIIADKLRGYLGLVDDLFQQPDKVVAACEALMPHLYQVAKMTADPDKLVPIGYWMHRGGVPFVSPEIFRNVYWATVKPIIEELWDDGHQTLFYAEGKWDHHLEAFAELPEQSIVFHVDQDDIFKAHRILGKQFLPQRRHSQCAAGLRQARGGPGPLQEGDRGRGSDGGYIVDAGAIVQNEAPIENVRAMTNFIRENGVYSSGSLAEIPAQGAAAAALQSPAAPDRRPGSPSAGSLPSLAGET